MHKNMDGRAIEGVVARNRAIFSPIMIQSASGGWLDPRKKGGDRTVGLSISGGQDQRAHSDFCGLNHDHDGLG